MALIKYLGSSGPYLYLLFICCFLMWSFIFYVYLNIRNLNKKNIVSLKKRKKYFLKLNTVFFMAGIAPIIGLLGTVDGIIDIFADISKTSDVSAQIMAGGIGKALKSTQAGLVVAIPGLVLGNFIKEKYFFRIKRAAKGKKVRRKKDKNIVNDLNMTPLLDMVFILLIFFVVTSSFVENYIVDVNLTGASTGKTASKEVNFIVLDENGTMYFNNEKTDYNMLEKQVLKNNIKNYAIAPHKNVSSGKLIKLMDFLRKNKITNISVAVKNE